jgi:hypothetical protein
MGTGMGAVPPLPVLDVPGGWQATVEAWARRGEQLSLLVAEPDWVRRTDMDLGHVPGS